MVRDINPNPPLDPILLIVLGFRGVRGVKGAQGLPRSAQVIVKFKAIPKILDTWVVRMVYQA